jgi:L-rhamnose-H+ transport protein
MLTLGIALAVASGLCNGLFSGPMKMIPRWKWENIWLVFIVSACVIIPAAMVLPRIDNLGGVYAAAPASSVAAALGFGFQWGFGAILFGLSVDRLGVSLTNSLVIGVSSALGSVVPLMLGYGLRFEPRQIVLGGGLVCFLAGVWLCGRAGHIREGQSSTGKNVWTGLIIAIGGGVMSGLFNVGYSMALPIAEAGKRLGYPQFDAINAIWLLMLGAGAIPNIVFCVYLMRRNQSAACFGAPRAAANWSLSLLTGILWSASIFLYGAATPWLGDLGPSIGWPLSLAVGLLVANLFGVWLGEWRTAPPAASRFMRWGIVTLVAAIVLCALSSKIGA